MNERKFREIAIQAVVDYFNGQVDYTDKNEGYLDAYKKWKKVLVKDEVNK